MSWAGLLGAGYFSRHSAAFGLRKVPLLKMRRARYSTLVAIDGFQRFLGTLRSKNSVSLVFRDNDLKGAKR